jgi:hypothetical protein
VEFPVSVVVSVVVAVVAGSTVDVAQGIAYKKALIFPFCML